MVPYTWVWRTAAGKLKPYFGIKTRRTKRLAAVWRHHPDLNWGIKVLQTSALPLGYGAALERKTRFELATFALARRRSTTEPLPQKIGDLDGARTHDL